MSKLTKMIGKKSLIAGTSLDLLGILLSFLINANLTNDLFLKIVLFCYCVRFELIVLLLFSALFFLFSRFLKSAKYVSPALCLGMTLLIVVAMSFSIKPAKRYIIARYYYFNNNFYTDETQKRFLDKAQNHMSNNEWDLCVQSLSQAEVLLISFSQKAIKGKGFAKTISINKNVVQTVVLGLLIACTVFFSVRLLHKFAKKRNASLIENRHSCVFMTDAIYESMPEDYVLKSAFYAIKDAIERDYTDRDVVRLRKQLNIDDDFAKGIHFSSPADFIMYLYSLKGIDGGVKPYINEADSLVSSKIMLDFYQDAALRDYEKGDYYNASAEVAHYFRIYSQLGDFPLMGVNNKMHILRLLLQRQWDLTTNREFAKEAYSCFRESYCDYDNSNFDGYGKLRNNSNNIPFLINISSYFEGLSQFHNQNHMSALHQFETCYENTTDTILQQYCALMSIRTAFWNYDRLRNAESLNLYRKIYKKYSPTVTYYYFKPDLERYQSVVAEIINNPQYTGYDY